MRRLIFFFLLGIIVSCSSERDTVRLVNQAEKIVQEHPDQALRMLDTLSRGNLSSRKERARYGIVKSMALTKNWIEPSSDSLIRPAVDYYGKSRQYDYRMKAWLYLGRVQLVQGELVASLYSFKQAEHAAENTGDDRYKGLIQMGLADVYNRNYNSPEALKHVKKALPFFLAVNDRYNYDVTQLRQAEELRNLEEWDTAEALFDSLAAIPDADKYIIKRSLLGCAHLCIHRPDPKPDKAKELLLNALQRFPGELTEIDYCNLAQAFAMTGDIAQAEGILDQVEALNPKYFGLKSFRAEILSRKGDYKGAYRLSGDAYRMESKIIRETLKQSTAVAERDYFTMMESQALLRTKKRNSLIIFMVVGSILLIAGLWSFFSRRKKRDEWEKEQFRSLSENTTSALASLTGLADRTDQERRDMKDMQIRVMLQTFRNQMEGAQSAAQLYESLKQDDRKWHKAYDHLKEQAQELFGDEWAYKRLEKRVNEEVDGIMMRLRKQVALSDEGDYRLACYLIAGCSPGFIAERMNRSLSTIYSKKSRLLTEIRKAKCVDEELFIFAIK
ncbi:MAG: hypothetical protein IJ616_09640 [Bacteroidales bacterium]|nr:hypothetical protein [Bacteroidales bacterium]